MKTTRQHLVAGLAAVIVLLAPGCKKAADDAAVDADGKTAAAAVPEKGDPQASQALAGIKPALEKNDYDAAIAALVAAKQSGPMSDAQSADYRRAVNETTQRLLEAAQTDAKAKEAYENFGRLMKGH